MKHISTLLEKLAIPTDIIDSINAETLPEDFDQKVEAYNKSRIDYFKATPEFKTYEKQIGDRTYEGAVLKHKKRLNEALGLGLTNAQLEEIPSIEDFIDKTKNLLTDREQKLINSSDATLKTDLEKYKNDYSKLVNEKGDWQLQIEKTKTDAENEKNAAIELFKAEMMFEKMIREDKKLPNTEGQDFVLDSIKTVIFNSYIVKGDGTIFAKDGTAATHPEKQTIVRSLSELYEYYKTKANLVIRSNAGAGASGAAGSGGSGLDPAIAAKMEELRNARQR